MPKVVVVGGTFVDMAIRCEQIPSPGQRISGSALSYSVSGPGPNQAVQVALCGCEAYLISKVGGDPFAKSVRNTLTDFKVNTDFLYTAEAKNTGTVVTMVSAIGENTSLVYTGANSALHSQDIESAENIFSQADVCLIHGELPIDAIIKAIRCAELFGVKIILNPASPIEHLDSTGQALPNEYFSADILIPNLYEAAEIAEQSTTAGIHAAKLIGSDLVARGAKAAVITMGKRGCMIVDRNGADHIPAYEIELVDQAGRGDAFAGALAACIAAKDNLAGAVRFASAAGALACTKFGSIEAMPTRAEIIELMQKQDTE
jgi:ribokinase